MATASITLLAILAVCAVINTSNTIAGWVKEFKFRQDRARLDNWYKSESLILKQGNVDR